MAILELPAPKSQSTAKSRARHRRSAVAWPPWGVQLGEPANATQHMGVYWRECPRARTVQGARVDLFCFVLRVHSQLGDVRKRFRRQQSMRATIFVCYQYRSHAWSSSHTRLNVCLDDCAVCNDDGVVCACESVRVCECGCECVCVCVCLIECVCGCEWVWMWVWVRV